MTLDEDITLAITESTGQKAEIINSGLIGGGSIHNSRKLVLKDGRTFFVKTHPHPHHYPGMYETEFQGLELLASPGCVRVPEPVCYSDSFIVMEYIEHGSPGSDWQVVIGNQLACLHKATQQDDFGFHRDNYLGTTVQPNEWTDNWLEFWRSRRMAWQLDLFREKTDSSDPLLSLCERLINKLDAILGSVKEPAVLLHGDLWSGNAGSDEEGRPVIYDPACYYGHREAEIGMMRLFGGFGARCESAYQEVWAFKAGYEERILLYKLYHQMNHLNLFGNTYYQACLDTLKQLV